MKIIQNLRNKPYAKPIFAGFLSLYFISMLAITFYTANRTNEEITQYAINMGSDLANLINTSWEDYNMAYDSSSKEHQQYLQIYTQHGAISMSDASSYMSSAAIYDSDGNLLVKSYHLPTHLQTILQNRKFMKLQDMAIKNTVESLFTKINMLMKIILRSILLVSW